MVGNQKISGQTFIPVICKALGIEPDNVRSIIIEAEWGDVVKVYITQLGDNRLLEVDWNNTLKGVEQFQTITKLPPDHPGISTAAPFDLLLNELRPLLPGVIKVDTVSNYLPNIDKATVVREINGAQVSTDVFVEKTAAGLTIPELARLIVETVNRADAETAS